MWDFVVLLPSNYRLPVLHSSGYTTALITHIDPSTDPMLVTRANASKAWNEICMEISILELQNPLAVVMILMNYCSPYIYTDLGCLNSLQWSYTKAYTMSNSCLVMTALIHIQDSWQAAMTWILLISFCAGSAVDLSNTSVCGCWLFRYDAFNFLQLLDVWMARSCSEVHWDFVLFIYLFI